jgi:hypothetical protein
MSEESDGTLMRKNQTQQSLQRSTDFLIKIDNKGDAEIAEAELKCVTGGATGMAKLPGIQESQKRQM